MTLQSLLKNPKKSAVQLRRSLCKESFEDFVRCFWECVPGAGDLVWNWHMSLFCTELQKIGERVFATLPNDYDLLCNVSPGTSKSTVFSILFHPWTWTRMPHARHINASHTDTLVLDHSYKAREVLRDEKFKETFPDIVLRDNQGAKSYYMNTAGGCRFSCTVAGKTPMGLHAHFLTVDDPIDPQKALSIAELLTANNFMTNVLPSRKTNKLVSTTMVVMQRLDRNDPAGTMLDNAKKEGATAVKHICLPAELTDDVKPSVEEIRAVYPEAYTDGLMDPVRMPRVVLKNFRSKSEYAYAGQFLQRPTPPGGGMFKDQYFAKRVKAAPYAATRIRYFDRAATADGGCFTAGVLIAKDALNNYYIEDMIRGQWEPKERNERMRATALKDRLRYGPQYEPTFYFEGEGGSSGRDSAREVIKALAGFKVVEDLPTGSKDTRAEPWSSQLAGGNVYIVDNGASNNTGTATWDIQAYIDEHTNFRPMPGKRVGKYMDQVDASSGAFNLLSGARTIGSVAVHTLGKNKAGSLRIVVASRDELANLVVDHRTLLVSFQNPPMSDEQLQLPGHALNKNLDALILDFLDADPAEHQEVWDDPLPGYNESIQTYLMRDSVQGKKLWSFLLKKRDPAAEVWVLQDDGDRRALSGAIAICHALRLPETSTIHRIADPDWKFDLKVGAPNPHVHAVVLKARGMVI